MARIIRLAILAVWLLINGSALATTYYVAANGSDSNSGTSKTAPWQHAPGMSGCTNTCSSTTPQPGDSIIFRGGDTWHHGNFPWTIGYSGNGTSSIYIGVDQTWFVGGSWVRPIFNLDAQAVSNDTVVNENGSHVTIDNIEFTGYYWNDSPPFASGIFHLSATSVWFKNIYVHGWSHGSSALSGAYVIGSSSYWTPSGDTHVENCLFDGTDTTQDSFGGVYGSVVDIHGSTFRWMKNGIVDHAALVYDNLVENIVYPGHDSSDHGNAIEGLGEVMVAYNNVIRHISSGGVMPLFPTPCCGGTAYIYNNVIYDTHNQYPLTVDTNGDSSSTSGAYVYNNTIQSSDGYNCVRGNSRSTYLGFMTVENTHCITEASSVVNWGSVTTQKASNNLLQTNSVANGQGYTATNLYASTAAGNATVGAGIDLTSSCTGNITALCRDTTLGPLDRTALARPSSGAWDLGAYEYGAQAAPSPPSGLTAIVQ